MMLYNFKPGVTLTVSVLIAIAILCSLGTWQALKVGPKTALIETINTNMTRQVEDFQGLLKKTATIEYRHVSLYGRKAGSAVKIFGTNKNGASGYFLYAPLKIEGGKMLIANFGWIPLNTEKAPQLAKGEHSYTGVLVPSAKAGFMTPENTPETNAWYVANVAELARHFGLKEGQYYAFRIFLDDVNGAGALPEGGQVRVDIPNNHLQYSFTWYGLALTLMVIYVLLGMKKDRKQP